MLVVVKKPPIRIEGEIPKDVLDFFESKFELEITKDNDEETINIHESEWFQGMMKKMHPGRTVKVYRENKGWTQKALGERLGGVDRQVISKIERGERAISKKMALALSDVFKKAVDEFLKE